MVQGSDGALLSCPACPVSLFTCNTNWICLVFFLMQNNNSVLRGMFSSLFSTDFSMVPAIFSRSYHLPRAFLLPSPQAMRKISAANRNSHLGGAWSLPKALTCPILATIVCREIKTSIPMGHRREMKIALPPPPPCTPSMTPLPSVIPHSPLTKQIFPGLYFNICKASSLKEKQM